MHKLTFSISPECDLVHFLSATLHRNENDAGMKINKMNVFDIDNMRLQIVRPSCCSCVHSQRDRQTSGSHVHRSLVCHPGYQGNYCGPDGYGPQLL